MRGWGYRRGRGWVGGVGEVAWVGGVAWLALRYTLEEKEGVCGEEGEAEVTEERLRSDKCDKQE